MLSDISKQLIALEKEAGIVCSTLVLPHWGGEMHGFSQTLYGYMMRVFAFIDLLSSYWEGGNGDNQSKRMLNFMNKYMRDQAEENTVAIHIWRHKLMHTAQPRKLHDLKKSKNYYWLLHWHEHLPETQHYTFSDSNDTRKLNIGLMYLINDLKQALVKYEKDLEKSNDLQEKLKKFQAELDKQEYWDFT